MPDAKTPVALTHATLEKMSRHEMLKWVNSTVQGEYKKIEELCSGVAYCQMMELLFPHSVCMKKVKLNPKLEHEYLNNLRQFQMAFTRIQYEKSVPIERLMKGRFQDNFEFLQWFKKFFDVHSSDKENQKVVVPSKQANVSSKLVDVSFKQTNVSSKQVVKSGVSKRTVPSKLQKVDAPTVATKRKEADSTTQVVEEQAVLSSNLQILQKSLDDLKEQIRNIQYESHYYYKKLTAIQRILSESLDKNEHTELCKKFLKVLFTAECDRT